jgi:tRNA (guanine-N7-)-methyltransferase
MTDDPPLGQKPFGPLRSYGRIKSRSIKPRQAGLMQTLLPQIAVDLADPFGGWSGPVWLEIGFGGGEHMAAQAARRPDVRILGAEPFVNGAASAVRHVEEQGLSNVRIHHGDARELVAALPDDRLERVFILFPDPWPKTRHHKRRLVSTATLDRLAVLMRPGAELRLATDDRDYLAWMLERATLHPAFEWLARGPADWRERPEDWPPTRYEEKARAAGRMPAFLRFLRRE